MNSERFAQLIAESRGAESVAQEDRDLARALLESGHVHLTDTCAFDTVRDTDNRVQTGAGIR